MESRIVTIKKVVGKLEKPFKVYAPGVKNPQWFMYQPHSPFEIDEGKISATPTEEFYQFIVDQANAYMLDGKEPPAEIATTIKNIADDHVNDRTPVIRAGDYIALQNYMRKSKS